MKQRRTAGDHAGAPAAGLRLAAVGGELNLPASEEQ
jgi:hypothetical protein